MNASSGWASVVRDTADNRAPTMSVCIPTFNRAEMLRGAIASVLAQSLEDFELVISDNASTDHTHDVVTAIRDPRVRYVRQPANVGAVQNFNRCLALARGNYVALFHDDDLMLPDNLRCKALALDENPRVGFVHSKFHSIDQHARVVKSSTNFGPPRTHDVVEGGREFVIGRLLSYNNVNAPSVVIRRDCYTRLGGFDESLPFTADFEYWMRIGCHYDVMFLARPLVQCRDHDGAGTRHYMMVIDGVRTFNGNGLQQLFAAKQAILRAAPTLVDASGEVRRSLRVWMADAVVQLMERCEAEHVSAAECRKSLFSLCRRFPEILRTRGIIGLIARNVLGARAVEMGKRAFSSLSIGSHE
jgi:hypothetical protein